MFRRKSLPYTFMALVPLLLALQGWLTYGFPEPATLSVQAYHTQLTMTLLTIISIPTLLKYVTKNRCGSWYSILCLLRMTMLCAIAVANLTIYYYYYPSTTFFYLAVMAWLAMPFAYPKTETNNNETHAS